MAQSFLGANPGTNVEDVSAPTLYDAEDVTGGDTGDAVEVNFPGRVAVLLEIGAVAGASSAVTIEIQGADNSDFDDDVVSLGTFDTFDENDDNTERVLTVHAWKRYMRAVATDGGNNTEAVVTVTVVPEDFHTGNTRTA